MTKITLVVCLLAFAFECVQADLKEDCLKAHNDYRIKHQSAELQWDDALAKDAEASANEENPATKDEINVFEGDNATAAVEKWHGTKNKYQVEDEATWVTAKKFIQFVWKSYTKVGCAITNKENAAKKFIVAKYSPAKGAITKELLQANVIKEEIEKTAETALTTAATVSTESATVLTESATVLTEAATVWTEAATVPTESATVPTESATVPTEAATVPTEAVTVPTEAATVPTEAATVLTEVESEPTEVESEPTEVESEPTEVESEPTEVETKPTDDKTKPTDDKTKPSDDKTKPTDDKTKPTDDKTKPTKDEIESTEAASFGTTAAPTNRTLAPKVNGTMKGAPKNTTSAQRAEGKRGGAATRGKSSGNQNLPKLTLKILMVLAIKFIVLN